MRRVIENLVANAVVYAGAADLKVGSSLDEVWVEISDAGEGIPAASLARVFEPFVGLETSRSRDTGGVGLGLAIAPSLARAHGGDVTLSPRDPHGLVA